MESIIECNDIDIVQITSNIDINHCNQAYFSEVNEIFQTRCVKIDKDIVRINSKCSTIHKNVLFKSENKTLKANKMKFSNFDSNSFCCLNSSHFLELIGECEKDFLQLILNSSMFYRNLPCDGLSKIRTFSKSKVNCILSTYYFSRCFQSDVIMQNACDVSSFACKSVTNLHV